MCALSFPLFKILFTGEYYLGYTVAPYLFMAPLLQMLFQVACNQFIVIKKTWPNVFILSLGAVFNILFNYLLIPSIGIEGAAIATLCGYTIANVLCALVLRRMGLMTISKRFLVCTSVFVVYFITWRIFFREQFIIGLILAIAIIIVFIQLYKNELRTIYAYLKGAKK